MVSKRVYKIDNIRAILIFLVVLGHFYEVISFPSSIFQRITIYSFHMPIFAFISGMCFKKNSKIFQNILYPYLVFQTIFVIGNSFVNGTLDKCILQYTTPFWALWYLMALSIWYLIANSLTFNKKSCFIIILISFLIAILDGLDTSVGYYLSLSRTIAYFPFFILGIYMKTYNFDFFLSKKSMLFKIISSGLIVISIIYLYTHSIKITWFYNSTNYSNGNYTYLIRLIQFAIALSVLAFFIAFITNKKIPIISSIGQNSMNVYILHMFIVKFLPLQNILSVFPYKLISIPIFALICVILLSRKPLVKIFSAFMRWPFNFKSKTIIKNSSIAL